MGNLFSRNFDPSTDLVDLRGRVAIVTGGNTGIGYATVQHLARAGAKVYLAARDESRATGALARLEHEGLGPGNGEVVWLKLDLADPREAKKAAEVFLERETRLDILVNNAGIIFAPYNVSPDGVSVQTTVNYISPFVFTRTLTPLLQKTAMEQGSDVRVVNVTSKAHQLISLPVQFKETSDFNIQFSRRLFPRFIRYAHGKFMMVVWTKTLQRRLDENPAAPITVISLHPGGVDTFSQSWPFPRLAGWVVGWVIAKPLVGAYTSVFAAASRKVADDRETYKGAYLESKPTGHIVTPNKAALSVELGDDLWKTTESFLEGLGIST